jgi:ankyrin repeat protein
MRNHRRSKVGGLAGLLAVAVFSLVLLAACDGSAKDRELLKAAEQGRLEQVRDLLRQGARLEARNVSGVTPLMLAAGRGELAVVAELLRAGADPNAQSTAGRSVLDAAVDKDNLRVVKALVAKGASAARLKDGGARLLATASSRPEMVGLLLAAGARTPLFQDRAILDDAVKEEDGEMLGALLRPFERKSWPGRPLEIVILARDRARLRALLRAGISPDGMTRRNGTPLTLAVGMSSSESVRILLDAGAAVDGEADGHLVPLVAAVFHDNLKIVDLLLSRGADVNHLPPRPGTTALIQAASQGNLEIVRRLLQGGANPNLRDADGFSPLEKAEQDGREEVVSELLAHGASRAWSP